MKIKQKIFVMASVLFCMAGLMGCQSAGQHKPAEPESITSGGISDKDLETLAAETVSETVEMKEPVQEAAVKEEKESFIVTYGQSQIEIPLSDCILEYDSEEVKMYVKDIEYKEEFPFCGTVVYMQTANDSMQILGMQDYCVDSKNQGIYIISRDEASDSFSSMYHYFLNKSSNSINISGAAVISAYLVEEWLNDAYQFSAERRTAFSDLWLIMTALKYDEQGNAILKGEASGICEADGKKYHIDWEIGGGEERVVPHEAKIYHKEEEPEIFAACEKAFDLIEKGDKSVLTLSSGQVEYFTQSGEQKRQENGERTWQRIDVNGDGLPELVAAADGMGGRNIVEWIFAYTGGMTKTVEAVYSDLIDYTEFLILGNNGKLIYDYRDHGNLDYGNYAEVRFDEKWERKSAKELVVFYFYGEDYYESEGMAEYYKDAYPDTYGKNGSGYYFFRICPKTGAEPENAAGADWISEEITKEEFVEAYREMTGLDFWEANEDFLQDFTNPS